MYLYSRIVLLRVFAMLAGEDERTTTERDLSVCLSEAEVEVESVALFCEFEL